MKFGPLSVYLKTRKIRRDFEKYFDDSILEYLNHEYGTDCFELREIKKEYAVHVLDHGLKKQFVKKETERILIEISLGHEVINQNPKKYKINVLIKKYWKFGEMEKNEITA